MAAPEVTGQASIFRPEAIERHRHAWLGTIQLSSPLPLALLAVGAVAAALLIVAALCIGEYTRKAHVSGYLVPDRGMAQLVTPAAGVVTESHAHDGQKVRRGDVLWVVSLDRATDRGDARASVQSSLATRERSLTAAADQQARLDQARRAAAERQLAAMRIELGQIEAEVDLQRQRLALAQQSATRLESLRGENFVSAAQLQTKAEEVLALRAQVQGLERQRAIHERDIGTLESQRRELPLMAEARQGEIERDRAVLAQQAAENEALRSVVVRAPQDGVLSGVLAQPGQSVAAATVLASLVPADSTLQAHLFAPSSAVGFLHAQQAVQLRYQAFPYQKFGHHLGSVAQVSRSPLLPTELAGLPLSSGAPTREPLYRITVDLQRQSVEAYGQQQSLAPGMQIDADVLLERRRLIEWIFEPVLSIAGRI
jgi:membrane fusion protein